MKYVSLALHISLYLRTRCLMITCVTTWKYGWDKERCGTGKYSG